MKQQELVRILLAPVISEKSTLLSEQERKFVFKVKKNSSKKNIKQAVELMFEVEVSMRLLKILAPTTLTTNPKPPTTPNLKNFWVNSSYQRQRRETRRMSLAV